MYLLITLTACAISGLVHTTVYIKLPMALAYEAQDMYSGSISD